MQREASGAGTRLTDKRRNGPDSRQDSDCIYPGTYRQTDEPFFAPDTRQVQLLADKLTLSGPTQRAHAIRIISIDEATWLPRNSHCKNTLGISQFGPECALIYIHLCRYSFLLHSIAVFFGFFVRVPVVRQPPAASALRGPAQPGRPQDTEEICAGGVDSWWRRIPEALLRPSPSSSPPSVSKIMVLSPLYGSYSSVIDESARLQVSEFASSIVLYSGPLIISL